MENENVERFLNKIVSLVNKDKAEGGKTVQIRRTGGSIASFWKKAAIAVHVPRSKIPSNLMGGNLVDEKYEKQSGLCKIIFGGSAKRNNFLLQYHEKLVHIE